MFRLYIRSHHQAGCRTLNKKPQKCNTIKLWGPDLVFTSVYTNTQLCNSTWTYMKFAEGLCKTEKCLSLSQYSPSHEKEEPISAFHGNGPYLFRIIRSVNTRLIQKVRTILLQKNNRVRFRIKFYCYQIQHSSNYFSTYSPPLLRHFSQRGTSFCIPSSQNATACDRNDYQQCPRIESLESEEIAGTDQKL